MNKKNKTLNPFGIRKESKHKIFDISIISKTLNKDKVFVLYDENKHPYSAITKQKTDINNKKNLSYIKDVLIAWENAPNFNGIGIVLGKVSNGNLTCLDIDNCIDDNGKLSTIANELIELLDTYTEISQSGKGIHCFFYAIKKGDKCKVSNIQGCSHLELYDKKRFIALTGNSINNKTISCRQEQCNYIYDKYFYCENESIQQREITNDLNAPYSLKEYLEFIECQSLKDKVLFNCWHGVNMGDDESNKDMVLFSKLAYYTNNNPTIMKELALYSPLFAKKDKKHKDKWLIRTDYLQRTIQKALRG